MPETQQQAQVHRFADPQFTPEVDRNEVVLSRPFGYDEIIDCPLFPTPDPKRQQKCCQFLDDVYSCLPNLVVLGSQKSGTTVLHSYFLHHPQLLSGAKKEFHLWDFDKNFIPLSSKLAQLLPRHSTVQALKNTITVDSTPTYLADPKGCARVKKILSPDARFVVLLRNPVDRLWSDILMKRRRVQFQDQFTRVLLAKNAAVINKCIDLCRRPCKIQEFRSCIPPEVAAHGRIFAFFAWVVSGDPGFQIFKSRCLKDEKTVINCLDGEFKHRTPFRETVPEVPRVIYEELRRLNSSLSKCCNFFGTPQSKKEIGRIIASQEQENPWGCRGCGCACFPSPPIMSDVAENFIWRSLYYAHFVHCFNTLEREKVLVFNYEELKSNPQSVLNKIFDHAGVNRVNMTHLTQEELHQKFKSRYPEFEVISGWTTSGLTVPIDETFPEHLKRQLQDFFRPYNQKLFELLKIEPYEGWSV